MRNSANRLQMNLLTTRFLNQGLEIERMSEDRESCRSLCAAMLPWDGPNIVPLRFGRGRAGRGLRYSGFARAVTRVGFDKVIFAHPIRVGATTRNSLGARFVGFRDDGAALEIFRR
jgi:hypothetical protein